MSVPSDHAGDADPSPPRPLAPIAGWTVAVLLLSWMFAFLPDSVGHEAPSWSPPQVVVKAP